MKSSRRTSTGHLEYIFLFKLLEDSALNFGKLVADEESEEHIGVVVYRNIERN